MCLDKLDLLIINCTQIARKLHAKITYLKGAENEDT
jgi:hypothetical protein